MHEHPILPKDTLGLLKVYSEKCCGFHSTERPGTKASNSELKRWLDKKSVLFNGIAQPWDRDPAEYLISTICDECGEKLFLKPEIILHPKGIKRVSL